MLKYARNKVVNIVAKGENKLLVHGVLDDDIYSCEINFEVQRPQMRIKSLQGKWHRFTTPDCPRALDMIEPAVGCCIGDAGFSHFINKEVGRKGCEHFANLITECAAAALEANLVLNWQKACESDPDLGFETFLASGGQPAEGTILSDTLPAGESAPAVKAKKSAASQKSRARSAGDGFVVDLHVHSFPASPCATDAIDEMILEAKRIGLNAICITDHNYLWPREQIAALSEKYDFTVFRGNEITTDQGDMVVFGFYEDIQGIISIGDLQRKVAAAGGVIIAAHPFRGFKTFDTTQLGLTPESASQRPLFKSVNAIEVLNGKVTPTENEFARQVADVLNLSGSGGSDAHAADEVGQYATEFDAPLRNEKDLVDALRSGNYHPVVFRDMSEDK